jgi:hypothetical protein
MTQIIGLCKAALTMSFGGRNSLCRPDFESLYVSR